MFCGCLVILYLIFAPMFLGYVTKNFTCLKTERFTYPLLLTRERAKTTQFSRAAIERMILIGIYLLSRPTVEISL